MRLLVYCVVPENELHGKYISIVHMPITQRGLSEVESWQ